MLERKIYACNGNEEAKIFCKQIWIIHVKTYHAYVCLVFINENFILYVRILIIIYFTEYANKNTKELRIALAHLLK